MNLEIPMHNISIIILNWNGKHHLEECLTSVLKQTYNKFELIVVDNGSTDGSQEYLKEYFPGVKLICLDKNYGFCKGNNIGIKESKGEYIVLLNNDTVVLPNWLENLYSAFNNDSSIGICASKMISYYNKSALDSAGDGFSICGAGFKIGHTESPDFYSENKYVFGACAGAAMYRRDMLNEIGLLDEDFFAIYEDVDLSFRAQLAGYKCIYCADAVVYHKTNATIGKLSDFYVYNGQRNVEYAYFKNMPSDLMIKTIFPHLAFNILSFGYFLLKGKGTPFIKAKIDFLKNLNRVKKKRKEIAGLRSVDSEYILLLLERKWLSSRIKGK
jgi:GT2 family glycosyltransferase